MRSARGDDESVESLAPEIRSCVEGHGRRGMTERLSKRCKRISGQGPSVCVSKGIR